MYYYYFSSFYWADHKEVNNENTQSTAAFDPGNAKQNSTQWIIFFMSVFSSDKIDKHFTPYCTKNYITSFYFCVLYMKIHWTVVFINRKISTLFLIEIPTVQNILPMFCISLHITQWNALKVWEWVSTVHNYTPCKSQRQYQNSYGILQS